MRGSAWITSLALLGLGLLGLCAAAPASAQMTAQITTWPGRNPIPLIDNLNNQNNAVSLDECENVTIDVLYNQIPTAQTTLFYFYGNGCELDMPTRNTDQSACISLMRTVPTNMNVSVTDTVAWNELLDCTSSETTRNFYVMAMNTETDSVTTGQYVNFTVQFDFNAPAAPSGVEAANGENTSTLSWEGSSEELGPYDIFVDPSGCADGMTPTGPLVDDPTNPPESLQVSVDAPGTASSASVPIPDGVAEGGSFAIGIRATDLAGNVGDVTVVCATKINVTSFWEAYCMGEGAGSAVCDDSGGGCAVRPAEDRGHGWLFAALAALALAWRRRAR